MELRDYQQRDIADLRHAMASEQRRVVLYGATGYGKGTVAVHLLQAAYERGARACFVVDRIALIDDMHERLEAAGVPHGVVQANHPCNKPQERIQVCSAQTLAYRKLPECSLILVDECHTFQRAAWAQVKGSGALVVGLTATPFTNGMAEEWDGIVGSSTTDDLIHRGYLSPVRVFSGKETDMRGAATVGGEWTARAATERGTRIVCDVVDTWERITMERYGRAVKTLVFSSSIAHGLALKDQFDATGYRFEQVSAHTSAKDMQRLSAELRDVDSDLVGLISVEKLAKGFDVPNVRIGVGCRPYRKSLSGFIQSFGRVMRAKPDGGYACWIDHCGNIPRFMDDMAELFERGCHGLESGKLKDAVHKEPTEREKKAVTCACGTILMPWDSACPSCGKPRRAKKPAVEKVEGVMQELTIASKRDAATGWFEKAQWMAAFKTYAKQHGYKSGWSAYQYKTRYGTWPNDVRVRNVAPGDIFPEAQGYIRGLVIRASKRKAA